MPKSTKSKRFIELKQKRDKAQNLLHNFNPYDKLIEWERNEKYTLLKDDYSEIYGKYLEHLEKQCEILERNYQEAQKNYDKAKKN